jgi:hypothetical protein
LASWCLCGSRARPHTGQSPWAASTPTSDGSRSRRFAGAVGHENTGIKPLLIRLKPETTIGCLCTMRSKLRQTKAAASYRTPARLREIEKRRSVQYQLKDILAAASLCPRRDATMLTGRGRTTANSQRASGRYFRSQPGCTKWCDHPAKPQDPQQPACQWRLPAWSSCQRSQRIEWRCSGYPRRTG